MWDSRFNRLEMIMKGPEPQEKNNTGQNLKSIRKGEKRTDDYQKKKRETVIGPCSIPSNHYKRTDSSSRLPGE